MRRYGEPASRRRHYRRRPGVYAILPRGGDVLLTHQMDPEPEIQLPGGGVDPGETPLQALHREVHEETGWRIGGARRVGAYRRFVFLPEYGYWAEKLCLIYLAMPVRPHGPPREDGHSSLWMPAGLAAEIVASPGDRAYLARFARRQVFRRRR